MFKTTEIKFVSGYELLKKIFPSVLYCDLRNK